MKKRCCSCGCTFTLSGSGKRYCSECAKRGDGRVWGLSGTNPGIAKAKDRGVKFGRKRELTDDRVEEIKALRQSGETVPAIIKRTGFSKASIYRSLKM